MERIWEFKWILGLLPCYLGTIWATGKFCKKYLKIAKRNEMLFWGFLLSSWLLMGAIGECRLVPYMILTLAKQIFFIVLVCVLFQGEQEKKIFVSSLLLLFGILLETFCESFLCGVVLLFMHTVKKIPEPVVGDGAGCLIACLSFLVAIGGICWMSKHFSSIFSGKKGRWYLIAAVPLIVILAVFDLAKWGAGHGILLRSGGNFNLYYDQIFSYTGNCVLTALSMFAAGIYLFGMDRIYLEQEKSSQYHAQVMAYKMLEEQYSRQERLRHDLKNHLIALSGLLENREWEKMRSYLSRMCEGGGLEDDEEMTGSSAVDALLYRKRKEAEEKKIRWDCEVHLPGECGINEFDLCVLFGNILDNAVEACDRMTVHQNHDDADCFIHVQAKKVKRFFLLEVRNSADKMEQYKAGHSNKGNVKGHGIGLLNVCDVVQRYHGVMNVESQDGVFTISLLLPMEEPDMTAKELFETGS